MHIIDRKIGEGVLIDGFRYVIALGTYSNQIRIATGITEHHFITEMNYKDTNKLLLFLNREQCKELILAWGKSQFVIH